VSASTVTETDLQDLDLLVELEEAELLTPALAAHLAELRAAAKREQRRRTLVAELGTAVKALDQKKRREQFARDGLLSSERAARAPKRDDPPSRFHPSRA
jgi:hypothetical protein